MSLNQAKARELIFQIIFANPITPQEQAMLLKTLMHQHKIAKKYALAAFLKFDLYKEKEEAVKEMIKSYSKGYDPERITGAEKAAIKLGLFELFFDHAIPGKVAISEAIRLGKKYGSEEGAGFVNALLDDIYHQRESRSFPLLYDQSGGGS